MNTISMTICRVRERLSDSLCHIGWGFMGQGCDCGSTWPDMNWLARITAKYVDDWPDELDAPRTRKGRLLLAIGSWFYSMGCRLMSGSLMQAYQEAVRPAETEPEVKPRKQWQSLPKWDRISLWHRYCKGEKPEALAVEYDVSVATAYRYIRTEYDESALAIWRYENQQKETGDA